MKIDHQGKILEKTITARNIGTTVSVSDFFKTLPVRKSEFLKNYRKDFNKMVQLLQEYCLNLTGVKIICTNQSRSGSRVTVLNTNGNSVLENITSIFGPKQSQELVKIKCATNDGTEDGCYTQESLADLDDSNSVLDIKQKEIDNLNKGRFKLEGFISNIEHSSGRTSKDRQYFYVNSRPVEIKSIIKIVNEVYHRYNAKSSPFVYLNLKMDQSNVDINLSKDKRQVAICDDKILMFLVKRSLLNTFGELPSKFKFTSINNSVKTLDDDDEQEEDEEDKIMVLQPTSNFSQSLKQWKLTPADPTPNKIASPAKRKLDKSFSPVASLQTTKTRKIDAFFDKIEVDDVVECSSVTDVSMEISCKTATQPNTLKFEPKNEEDDDDSLINSSAILEDYMNKSGNILDTEQLEMMEQELINSQVESDDEIIEIDTAKEQQISFKSTLKISINAIAASAKVEEELEQQMEADAMNRSYRLKFKEKIDPSKNDKAEVELETEIKKETFSEMEVLGQFNLGFIIAKLGSDLFIVDQHATDEKYNYEDLQKSLKIESQKMLVPEKLELTAIQEDVIIENLPIFEMNGFKFHFDHDADATKRISLTSRPYSKNWEFGKEDIEELIFILVESPMTICRPTRISKMLASRACRKSVMIGDPLNRNRMKKLLMHMGEIDHPWNCPHGRPTIRFLQNLDFIDDKKF